MPTQMNLPTLVAEAVLAELARNPELYRSVTPGPKGEDLTLVSIVMEADYSMTLTFSDGTTYNTPPIRGERGPKGVEGNRGPRGVGIHHTRWTATTNPEHHFGVAGHMDTYTLYGDEDELVVLGWFSVKNGENGKDPYDYAVEAGYEGTKDEFYKAIAENATHIEQIRNLVSQTEHLFDMVENKGQEFIDQINQIIEDFLAMKGAPGGFAELDENGKVPVEQIPDEVRGIIRVNTHAELPISGVPRQLYLVVQDETAEGASTLYHWAEFEYRPATSSTTVLGLTELRGLIAALDEDKASRQELNDARTELAADTLAVKEDLEALTELVGVLGDFRELVFVAHRMHLPVEGEDEVLYIVRSDETNFGDLSIYAWTIDGYRRVSGKMQEAIDQRITALVEATDADLLDHEQRLAIVEAFREVIGFAHFMYLPDIGDETKLYIIASDETFGGDLTAYRWSETLGNYTRMYGKAFADIKERLEVTESGKVEGDTFETYVNEVAEILNNYDERLTLLEEKDEVIEVNTRYDLPATGKHGVIYVVRHDSLSNNKATIHIWNGEDYSPIVSSYNTVLGEDNSSASEVLATQVWNTTTNDIAAGTPVMLAGHAINGQPAVVPLDLDDPEVLSKFVGITYKTVSAGKSGVAVRGGVVRNFNTLGGDENWQNGDALYFRGNGSGVISNTIPSTDNYNKPVGYVLEAADNKGILHLVQDPVGNILGGGGGGECSAPVVWLQGAEENVLLTDLSPNTMHILDTRSGKGVNIVVPDNHPAIPVGTEYHFVCAGSPDNVYIGEAD
jgi:hypothetical protein